MLTVSSIPDVFASAADSDTCCRGCAVAGVTLMSMVALGSAAKAMPLVSNRAKIETKAATERLDRIAVPPVARRRVGTATRCERKDQIARQADGPPARPDARKHTRVCIREPLEKVPMTASSFNAAERQLPAAPHSRNVTRQHQRAHARAGLGNRGEEALCVSVAEGRKVFLNSPERRAAHARAAAIRSLEEAQCPPKRAALRIEREIDQHIVVEVHDTIQVEVSVQPSGEVVIEAVVDAHVIVEVDAPVEVGVAIPGVLDQHGRSIDGLTVERRAGAVDREVLAPAEQA